ncbi:MAG: zonular occludens toxin domain-containing protein [Fibromonadales bacterium]|nr:zonular occludens toxin domain-containing protein [Fibromonadales bacterium]
MIIAYTGLPGGGKSLSSLADFVLPQLRKERPVFCNIAGLSPMLVACKLETTTPEINRNLFRFSMAFDDDDARSRKEFWKVRSDGSRYYADIEGLKRLLYEVMSWREAVLVLDECHEYLCPENWKLLRPFLKYLSMARHYGHDIILITQHITDIWEPLRNRVHETHDFVRGQWGFKAQYKEKVYHGWNVFASPGYTKNRLNDKSLYKLYKSHDGGAKEHIGYISLWQNKKIIAALFAVLFLASFSAYNLRHGFFGEVGKRHSELVVIRDSVPEFSQGANVIYVKYVVCGAYDCKATRPDGSVLNLPLDYASGKYPMEVRKYVPQSSMVNPGGFAPPGLRPGLPNQAGRK